MKDTAQVSGDTARISVNGSLRTLAFWRIVGQVIVIGAQLLVLWSLSQEYRITYG